MALSREQMWLSREPSAAHSAAERRLDRVRRLAEAVAPVAIVICGQARSFGHVAPDIAWTIAPLRYGSAGTSRHADVFLALDRISSKGSHAALLPLPPIIRAIESLHPVDYSIVNRSTSLAGSLMCAPSRGRS